MKYLEKRKNTEEIMITNFEKYTHELTPKEIDFILPRVIKILSERQGKEKVATNQKIVDYLNGLQSIIDADAMTSTRRIRKIIHEIRVNGDVPCLIATSEGYYIADNDDELEAYMLSLRERVNSIQAVYTALRQQRYDRKVAKESTVTTYQDLFDQPIS